MQINAAVVEDTEYNDPNPSIGSHDYYVTAVYDGGESEPSNVVTVLVTSIQEIKGNAVQLYPNPTDGSFTVRLGSEGVYEVSVTDITGKELHRSTIHRTSQFDIPGLNKGLYLIRIHDKTTADVLINKLVVK